LPYNNWRAPISEKRTDSLDLFFQKKIEKLMGEAVHTILLSLPPYYQLCGAEDLFMYAYSTIHIRVFPSVFKKKGGGERLD